MFLYYLNWTNSFFYLYNRKYHPFSEILKDIRQQEIEMVEIQKINADQEKSDTAEQEEMLLLENHNTLSDINQRAVPTTFNEKKCSVLSRKVELSAEMVKQIEANVESYKEVSKTRTEEGKPLLMDYDNTSPSTRILVHTKIDETECLLQSRKGKEPADVWGMIVQSIVTDILDNIPFNADDYRFVD